MTPAELSANLRHTPLFRDFSDTEIDECLQLLDPVSAHTGDIVVRQDELGDCMYLVVSGQCRVVHHEGGRGIDLAVLKDGDFFGELALVDRGPRIADVIALTDVTLLKLTQAAVAAVAGVYPTAAFKLLIGIGRIMVTRLRQANQRYVDSLLFPTQGKE